MSALLAGGLALGGSLLTANAMRDAADTAAAASRFSPIDITTGFGSVTTDPETGAITTALTPEMQALRDRLFGMTGAGLDQFQTFDPVAAGGLFTQQLNQLAAPGEEAARLGLENRLFQQGLLSSTPGANRSEALFTAQALAHNQRNLQGLQFGQSQQDRLFQQAMNALQAGTNIDMMGANLLSPFASIGGAATSAGQMGAQFGFQSDMAQADMMSAFFNNLASGINQPSTSVPSSFNADYGTAGMDVNQWLTS